jgi:hypothetical protein
MTITEEDLRQYRGIEGAICTLCDGWGVRFYGSTSTWRGGLGGCAMRHDVCDKCWGSGDMDRSWFNLRNMETHIKQQIAERAVDVLTGSVGAHYKNCIPAVEYIISVLCGIVKPRSEHKRPPYTYSLATSLAKVLQRAIEKTNGQHLNESTPRESGAAEKESSGSKVHE